MDLTDEQLHAALTLLVGTRTEDELGTIELIADDHDGQNTSALLEAVDVRREIFLRGAVA